MRAVVKHTFFQPDFLPATDEPSSVGDGRGVTFATTGRAGVGL